VASWARGLVCGGVVLGGWGDGHVEAKGLELAQVGADLAVAAGVVVVPAMAEVGESGTGIGEEVPVALCPPRGFRRLFRVLGQKRLRPPPGGGGGLSQCAGPG
jgi:hypothetical protein